MLYNTTTIFEKSQNLRPKLIEDHYEINIRNCVGNNDDDINTMINRPPR
jgi:hypothetical protein